MLVSFDYSNKCGNLWFFIEEKIVIFVILSLVCSSLHHSSLFFTKHQSLILNPCKFSISFLLHLDCAICVVILCVFENELFRSYWGFDQALDDFQEPRPIYLETCLNPMCVFMFHQNWVTWLINYSVSCCWDYLALFTIFILFLMCSRFFLFVTSASISSWVQFRIEMLSNMIRISTLVYGRLWHKKVSTVRKEELKVILLWWRWRKITRRQSWELSNIRSIKGNRSDKKSVGLSGFPYTNTWRRLLWITRLLDQDHVGSCFMLVV